MATLRVVGSGEAFDHGLGNSSYLLSGKGVPTLLFDCGYQIPERLWAKRLHNKIAGLVITHLHADHIFGIVPLLARYWEEKRRAPFAILGPRGTESYIRRLMEYGYPGLAQKLGFTLEFQLIDDLIPLTWKGLLIRGSRTQHSILNHTVRVDTTPELTAQEEIRDFSFSISGDGRLTPECLELINGVKLHVQEVFTCRTPLGTHYDLQSFRAECLPLNIKKFALTHFARTERTRILREIRVLSRKDPRIKAPRPGESFTL